MKLLSNLLLGIGIAFLLLCVLVLRPVPVPHSLDQCIAVTGEVKGVYEGGTLDALFVLEGTNRRFYINRGLEDGLSLQGLRDELVGKEVTMYYPKYWTPLDPSNSIKHVSQLNLGEEVIWTEIR